MLVNLADLAKKDTRDQKVTKDHLDLPVNKVSVVPLALLVMTAHLDPVAHKDQWVRRENKDNAVIVVNKDVLDYKAFLVHLELKEKLVMLEELVYPVKRVDRVNLAHKVQKAPLAYLVLLDNPVRLVIRVNPVNEDNLVHLEILVLVVQRVTLAHVEKMVPSDHKVLPDQWVHLVTTAPRDMLVLLACLVTLVILVNLDDLVWMVLRENLVMMVVPEKSDNLVHKVILVHKDPKVDVDPQAHPVQMVKKVKRVPKVTPVMLVRLVCLVNLVPKVPLENLVSMVSGVYLDLSANLDYLVNLEAWENLAPLDLLVLRVPRVNPDLKVRRVTMVSSV